jgi:hypothetical protein
MNKIFNKNRILKDWNIILGFTIFMVAIFVIFGFYLLFEIKDSRDINRDELGQGEQVYLNEEKLEDIYNTFDQRENNTSDIISSR